LDSTLVVPGVALGLLGLIAGDRANDSVFLSAKAIHGSLYVSLGLGSLALRLALGVLLFPRLLPGGGTGQTADSIDDGSLYGMILARDLARFVKAIAVGRRHGIIRRVEQ